MDETGFTESLGAGNIPVGSGFSPRAQWKFTSLAPIVAQDQKCLNTEQGKKAQVNPSTTPPAWLR